MKKYAVAFIAAMYAVNVCYSQNEQEIKQIQSEISTISTVQKRAQNDINSLQKRIRNDISKLQKTDNNHASHLNDLQNSVDNLKEKTDSLTKAYVNLSAIQKKDSERLIGEINDTNDTIGDNYAEMALRTKLGIGILVLTVFFFGGYLFVRRRSDSLSMDEVRKAQDALRVAQEKMQEDSVKLDNQMLALVEKQMNATPVVTTAATETDHSLALKVADEIVRIELNLSRMDSTVKGYKQLSKAVERIKNNFQANGYEIVDMLGKSYNEGMKVVANFVPDENLKEGEQIITGVTKPQINYNGKMIQSAQITVSQNI